MGGFYVNYILRKLFSKSNSKVSFFFFSLSKVLTFTFQNKVILKLLLKIRTNPLHKVKKDWKQYGVVLSLIPCLSLILQRGAVSCACF